MATRSWYRRTLLICGALACAAGGLGCNRIAAARGEPTGPSVLLVTIDTLRADYARSDGARAVETPTLDLLAREGLRFERASATAPVTLPSHTSILTGLYPPHHGVRHNGIFRAGPELESVAERFRAAGYTTGAFVAADVLARQFGLDQGFDHYDDETGGTRATSAGFAERPAAVVTDRALAWVAHTPGPFFAWLHYYDVHADYQAPEPYRTRFAANPYAGEVAYVDAQLGRLVAALRASGRLDDTVIAVTSDHGEGLGEHGEAAHSYLVYESVLHVPWILRGPGVPAGRRVATVVSNAAVAPTLVELAGLSPLAKTDVPSAVATWRDDAAASAPGEAYAESLVGQLDFGWAPLYAMRRGDEKFIEAPRPELYALGDDAGELANLLDSAPHGERVAAARERIAAARSAERALAAVAVDAQTRAQIESLGYVVPDPSAASAGRGEDPKDVHRYARLANDALAAFHAGDDERAYRLARAALERLPRSVHAHDVLARLLLRRNLFAAALPHARIAAEMQPNVPDHHSVLGLVHVRLGQSEAAVAAFERKAALEPDAASSHVGLMWRAKVGGTIDAAASHAERALALAPDQPALWETVGEVWEDLGEHARALALYEAAAARFPGTERLQMRLAVQAARRGDATASAAHLAAAGPAARDFRLAARLAAVYLARGETARAEPLLRDLAPRDPTGAVRTALARLQRETGRSAEAQQLLQPPAKPNG